MKLNIIIPVRDRDKELKYLLDALTKIFLEQKIEFKFYVVYQENTEPFNKGYLNNIGFLISLQDNFSPFYLFNDVTVYPINSKVYNYNFKYEENTVYNPYGYKHCLARFFLTDKDTYLKLNGYSNSYNGWGYEDQDLQKRCNIKNVTINRDIFYLRGRITNKFKDKMINIRGKMRLAEKNTKIVFNNKWVNKVESDILLDINNDGLTSIDIKKGIKIEIVSDNITKIFVYDIYSVKD